MKPFIYKRTLLFFITTTVLLFGLLSSVSAQTSSDDPTAIKIPEEKMEVPLVPDQARYKDSAWLKLGGGILCAAGGTVLCILAGNSKADYNAALDAWNLNPNDTTVAAKTDAGLKFFLPLIPGIGLTVTGVVLAISGLNDGVGIYGYKPLTPAPVSANGSVSGLGLYAFVSPTSVGIVLK